MSQPPPAPGHNVQQINYASEEVERLGRDYAETARAVEDLRRRFEAAPAEIATDEEKGAVAALIVDMRSAGKRVEGFREAEKTPHFRRGQGVDQFFNGLYDRLFRREKRNQPGMGDALQERLTAYDTRKLREEEERRRIEAERLAREAEAKRQKEERARAKAAAEAAAAEEARLAAERARKPEIVAEKKQAAGARQATADDAAVAAASAGVDAEIAAGRAQAAHVDTLARPADIMRRRDAATGVLTTMQREFYAEVTDATKLNKETLWPFIPLAAKEQALRAWAKTTGHGEQMAGAAIGSRPKSVVR